MLALCTLSTETAEQFKASSALLPALPKPLSVTINGKVEEVERQPSNDTATSNPSTRYVQMLMPITHSCQVFMHPKLFHLFFIPLSLNDIYQFLGLS